MYNIRTSGPSGIAFYGFFLTFGVAIRPRLAPVRSEGIRRMAEMLFESVIEVLGGAIAEVEGYFCGRLVGIEEVSLGQEEALSGEVAEYGGLEGLFESPLQLIFVEADCCSDLGEAGWAVDTLIDEVTGGDDPFLVSGGLQVSLFLIGRKQAGFGTQDKDLDAFGEQE